jgi:hypothetical protein
MKWRSYSMAHKYLVCLVELKESVEKEFALRANVGHSGWKSLICRNNFVSRCRTWRCEDRKQKTLKVCRNGWRTACWRCPCLNINTCEKTTGPPRYKERWRWNKDNERDWTCDERNMRLFVVSKINMHCKTKYQINLVAKWTYVLREW